ncbi:sensor histidine kinase [Shewanella algae]|uniref:sensor histidine kinase n=1 Tax=Shewanella carassii TaxID=1987584 RepID=UPI001BED4740|nr:HAMP domain-containing sensor histidine kinase [Shewanella carassii]BCV66707.1 hypothetical protein TUM17387_20660 [Shewanella carassii]
MSIELPQQPVMALLSSEEASTGKQKRIKWLTWMSYLLPWWLLVPLGSWMMYHYASQWQIDQLRYAQQELVDRDTLVLDARLARVKQDVNLLAQMTASVLADPQLDENEQLSLLQRLFVDFSTAYPSYMQVRWIGTSGVERVRVDHTDNLRRVVAAEALQDKSSRYYVIEANRLAPGAVYYSPFDLNIEGGEIEKPYRPTLRVATKVMNADGGELGLALLNLDGSGLLERLRQSGKTMLLDAEGYWLLSTDGHREWGFMFDDPEQRLAVVHPEVWRRMQQEQQGQFIDDSGMWTFSRVGPKLNGNSQVPVLYTLSHDEQPLFIQARLKQLYSGVGAAVLLCMTLLGAFLARSNLSLAAKAHELQQSNAALAMTLAQLRASQQELIRTEKLSSLGLMVAGVAHELNTPIGAAMLCVTALNDRVDELKRDYHNGNIKRSQLEEFIEYQEEGLTLAERNLKRSALLIQQFRQVAADRANADRQAFWLHELIADILALNHGQWKHYHHKLITDIPSDIHMLSYPGPLGQVIQNLVHNALIHAFEEADRGEVHICARKLQNQVEVCVVDNGIGIKEQDHQRVFDPFYTTKRSSGGTGLGLHIVHHLTTEVLGGSVRISSGINGIGTSMILLLPLEQIELKSSKEEAELATS